eukprot:CAMPEP_0197833748 /NCGR_PEP_ID=MMETSP1437-20131217/19990_1 /TAXON_ID=49252 ORGANISM="Eucampia antarctica, Strain CCMP1452" /NCGR_SAMPLE_ID=MMETSP1437 /ASSEMBLY_ACC=CAM_ASM_001096 /LENGTH=176 /DNA_ID=CAMNT_0043437991 /DNA_START=148 /DNA_END=675 /DNA_ORIENTATION=-
MTSSSNNSEDEKVQAEIPVYNVFRDSHLRYMGYANEIGESFRYQFPKLVRPTYVLAFGYCGMDALSTGYSAWKQPPQIENHNNNNSQRTKKNQVAIATMDTLLWQCLASVLIPGVTINMVVRASRLAIVRASASQPLPAMVSKWFPTFVGIASIPIIIHPIDTFVDLCLDNTIRKW